RITLSALIRLALELFMNRIALERQSYRFVTDEQLKWQAIRFVEKYTSYAQNIASRPHTHRFQWLNFATTTYW
ncbi:MAG TPA: hypothetical protein PLY93_09980, partial [Turneriella sp.]|nr:hypothetical protein [Turneriella sp.]